MVISVPREKNPQTISFFFGKPIRKIKYSHMVTYNSEKLLVPTVDYILSINIEYVWSFCSGGARDEMR